MSPAERRAGRFLRAPDGHGDGGGSGVGEGAAPLGDAGKGVADGGEADASATADDAAAAAGGEGDGGAGEGAADPLDEKGILDEAEGAKPEAKDGDDGKDAGDKKEGEETDAPLTGEVPEAYAVTAPEGTVLDDKAMELFDPVFRKLGLTDAGAQELVNAAPALIDHIGEQAAKAQVDQIVATRKEWAAQALADPEIGGKNLERSKQLAASVFDRYGLKPEGPFRTLLNESGLANHPDMIRVFAKIGHDMAEDGFPTGEGAPAAKGSMLERLYPNDQPKK